MGGELQNTNEIYNLHANVLYESTVRIRDTNRPSEYAIRTEYARAGSLGFPMSRFDNIYDRAIGRFIREHALLLCSYSQSNITYTTHDYTHTRPRIANPEHPAILSLSPIPFTSNTFLSPPFYVL